MVELAILQLVDNAQKYSEVGSPINVQIKQSTTETVVTVSNSGPPIAEDQRERIFQRFYRGNNASRCPSGTGLWLSVVKKAAEAHGGRAWVECNEGVTTFFFTLANYGMERNG